MFVLHFNLQVENINKNMSNDSEKKLPVKGTKISSWFKCDNEMTDIQLAEIQHANLLDLFGDLSSIDNRGIISNKMKIDVTVYFKQESVYLIESELFLIDAN